MSPSLKNETPTNQNNKLSDNKNRVKFLVLLLSIAASSLGGLQIFLTNRIAVRGEEIRKREEELARTNKEAEVLTQKILETGALSYIEATAREKLEMTDIQNQIIYIGPERFATR